MNETIESRVKLFLLDLNDYSKTFLEYEAEIDDVNKCYIGDKHVEMTARANDKYIPLFRQKCRTLVVDCNLLKKKLEDEADFTVSDMEAIEATGRMLKTPNIPLETVENIIKKFTSNINALEMLKAAALEEYKGCFKWYLFDSIAEVDKMVAILENASVTSNPSVYLQAMSEVRYSALMIAKHNGIDINEDNYPVLQEVRLRSIKAYMGL